MSKVEVAEQKTFVEVQGRAISFVGLDLLFLAKILVGKIVQIQLMIGGMFDRLLIHREGLALLVQFVIDYA